MLESLVPLILAQSLAESPVTVTEGLATDAPARLEVVEVRSTALQGAQGSVAGITTLDEARIGIEAATHANELFDSVPGAWISRGSGQEQLTAIRSPVLTGPGACGAFMILEDGVPIRPAGFCNVNELFEVNLLQARRVDVIRGPGSVIYGSNALHGVLDVSSADPDPDAPVTAGIMAGSDEYYRGRIAVSGETFVFSANYTDSGSFRVDEGFRHGFANGAWLTEAAGAVVRTQLSWADLDQDTAGFIFGKDAYLDPDIRRGNENPEAFRKARALRVTSRWSWLRSNGYGVEAIPYLRSSDMDFLQHFLPGKPLEENGQDSVGLLLSLSSPGGFTAGVDLEYADLYLVEFQENPTEGSDFLVETRPQGFHYDYDVAMTMLAAWAQWNIKLTEKLNVTAGIRGEVLSYDYRNNMLDGNTRDDGTECRFGGCLYTRPADRDDRFENLAPELGLNWSLTGRTTLFARIARGFRAPQATELYRLQRGQRVADLDSETLDTLEAGLRGEGETLRWDAALFAMRKDHFIFRDADGFNVSDGRTTHRGVEASLDWRFAEHWRLGANASYAKHEYDFDRPASGIRKGGTVDTAPEWLAGARLGWSPRENLSAELEWVHMDEYFLDPANQHRYEGHDLLHLRLFYALPRSPHRFALRVTNLLDDDYAERADFAFGQYRYFPGAGRRFFLEYRYAP